jgi:phosphoenolpyruvate carboxykinase (ATP)
VNTGWTGGPYGEGHRMKLSHTRTMVRAALEGKLDTCATRPDPVFGVHVPVDIPGVPPGILDPRGTWNDPARYDAQAAKLARLFQDNFKQFAAQVSEAVRKAGPNT